MKQLFIDIVIGLVMAAVICYLGWAISITIFNQ